MSAKIINYLYEDLPEGYTVLASDWNDAMNQIKEAINSHAKLLDQKAVAEYIIDIGSELHPWSYNDLLKSYYFIITQSTHNKGLIPEVKTYLQNGDETYDSPNINFNTGDVTVYSNRDIKLKVVIR